MVWRYMGAGMQRQPSLAASDVGSEHSDAPLMAQALPRSSSLTRTSLVRPSLEAPAAPVVAPVKRSAAEIAATAARRRTSLMRRSTLAVAAVRSVGDPHLVALEPLFWVGKGIVPRSPPNPPPPLGQGLPFFPSHCIASPLRHVQSNGGVLMLRRRSFIPVLFLQL